MRLALLAAALLLILAPAAPAGDKPLSDEELAKRMEKMEREARKNAPAQVEIRGVTEKQARSALLQVMLDYGCQPVDLGEIVTFEKEQGLVASAIAGVLGGARRNETGTAKNRVTFLVADEDTLIRIRNLAVTLVINEHLSSASTQDQTKKSRGKVQELLDRAAEIATQAAVRAAARDEKEAAAPDSARR